MELVVMTFRKFVASAYFGLCLSGVAYVQSPSAQQQKVRTDELVKQALDRYNQNLRAASQAGVDPAQLPAAAAGVVSVPMTLADAVQHAIDNNLELAVERLNPQTFDLTLASLRANYKPVASSTFGRRDNVRPPTNLLNPGSPNVSTMTYNS